MQVSFNREEFALLHETLSYALKRTYTEPEQVRIRDLQGRLEERLLDRDGPLETSFGVTEPEVRALQSAADIYRDALERPLSAEVSHAKARRVRELIERLTESPPHWKRFWDRFRRLK